MVEKKVSGILCEKCGFNNPDDFKFCGRCGTPLVEIDFKRTKSALDSIPSVLHKRMELESLRMKDERRRVVVMFIQIHGYFDFLEKQSNELIINRLFHSLERVIYKYEGYIDKVIEDCIMVLFGAPITHEDEIERSFKTVFELMDDVERFNKKYSTSFSLSAGIARGLCYAGEFGKPGNYTVIGKDVNLAKRLQEVAPPGSIYVSEDIYRLTKDKIDYGEGREITLRGMGIHRVYETYGFLYGRGGEGDIFIGRKREINRLLRLYQRFGDGEGSFCYIVGERGIGKTRLYREFIKYVDGNRSKICEARAISYLKQTPYFVLKEIIKSLLGITCLKDTSEDAYKLKIREFFSDKEELNFIIPFIKFLLSISLDEQERSIVEGIGAEKEEQNYMKDIFMTFFTMLAERMPLIFIIEDAQYMDQSSIDVLTSLKNVVKEYPLLIIFLFWEVPEYFPEGYILRLKPFSKGRVKELVKKYLKISRVPEGFILNVYKKTRGVPLFIVEILNKIKQNFLLKDRRMYKIDFSSLSIPDRVYDIVLSRIDSLEPPVKDTLKKASVIGVQFSEEILREMVDSPSSLEQILSPLKEKGFIEEVSSSGEKRIFLFKNEIIRDVSYDLLLKEEKRNLHDEIGKIMEKIYSDFIDEHIDEIAYHYYMAENLRYFRFMLKSGDRKFSSYKWEDALDSYKLCMKVKNSAILHLRMGRCYFDMGNLDMALHHFEKAKSMSKCKNTEAKAQINIAQVFLEKGMFEKALSISKSIEERCIEDRELKIENLRNIASALFSLERYEESLQYLNRILELNISTYGEFHVSTSITLNEMGEVYRETSNYGKALSYYKRAVESLEKSGIGSVPLLAGYYNNISVLYSNIGDFKSSLHYAKESIRIFEETLGKYHPKLGIVLNTLGVIYGRMGEFDSALNSFKRALKIKKIVYGEMHPEVATTYMNIGLVYMNKKEFEKADRYFKTSLDIFINTLGENHSKVALLYGNMGVNYGMKGDIENSIKYIEKALRINISVLGENNTKVALNYKNLGMAYFVKGDYIRSLSYYRKAMEIYTGIFDQETPQVISLYEDMAGVYYKLRDFNKRILYLEKALKALENREGKELHIMNLAMEIVDTYLEAGKFEKARDYFNNFQWDIPKMKSDQSLYKNFEKFNTLFKQK